MKEKRIVSAMTLITSLVGYFYAKQFEKDAIPIVMISGFFGALLGETIYSMMNDDDRDKKPPEKDQL